VIAPAKLPALERIMDEWLPDLVVHECTDLAAPIAAAVAGVPAVTQGRGLVPIPGRTTPSPADVVPLWYARGLEPDPYAGILGRLHLHPVPPGLQPDAAVPVGRLQAMRLDMSAAPGTTLPDWVERLRPDARPVVYVSLGTHPFFNQPQFFRTILAGLATLDCEVVATLGEHTDPSSLGPRLRTCISSAGSRCHCCCGAVAWSSATLARGPSWPVSQRACRCSCYPVGPISLTTRRPVQMRPS
jgi:hypothetical protein